MQRTHDNKLEIMKTPPSEIYLTYEEHAEEFTWSKTPLNDQSVKYSLVAASFEVQEEKKITKESVSVACKWSVDYLNEKTGSSYRANTRGTIRLVKARLSEGFDGMDFKRVIDNRITHWQGDSEMEQYLRPITLFGTKFESYLNSPNKVSKSGADQPSSDDFRNVSYTEHE